MNISNIRLCHDCCRDAYVQTCESYLSADSVQGVFKGHVRAREILDLEARTLAALDFDLHVFHPFIFVDALTEARCPKSLGRLGRPAARPLRATATRSPGANCVGGWCGMGARLGRARSPPNAKVGSGWPSPGARADDVLQPVAHAAAAGASDLFQLPRALQELRDASGPSAAAPAEHALRPCLDGPALQKAHKLATSFAESAMRGMAPLLMPPQQLALAAICHALDKGGVPRDTVLRHYAALTAAAQGGGDAGASEPGVRDALEV